MPGGNGGSHVVATAAEYLVKLGVQLDYGNMEKLESFLNSSKMRTLALGAALTAASTAIIAFMKAMTSLEIEYENLARKESRSLENVRAEQVALKAMGKTAQEVSQDPALQKMQEELEKIGLAMRLPDMTKVIANVRRLQTEFNGLKVAIQYSLQWLNYHLLRELEEPIRRITAYLKRIREWLQNNGKQVALRLSVVISDFVRGVEGILRLADRLLGVIDRLPDGVKAFGAAFTATFLEIKSGPLGQILTMITAIGDLIKSYENWSFNAGKGVTGGIASELYGDVKYWDENGYLSQAGSDYLTRMGISKENQGGIVYTTLNELWDPLARGDMTGVTNTVLSPITGAFENIVDNFGAVLNGESILQAIVNVLNGTTASVKDVEGLTPFGMTMAGIIGGAIWANWETIKGWISNAMTVAFGDFNAADAAGFGLVAFSELVLSEMGKGFEKDENTGKFKNGILNLIDEVAKTFGEESFVDRILVALGVIDENGKATDLGDKIEQYTDLAQFGVKVAGMLLSPKAVKEALAIDAFDLVSTVIASISDQTITPEEQKTLEGKAWEVAGDLVSLFGYPVIGAFLQLMGNQDVLSQVMEMLFGALEAGETDILFGKRDGQGLIGKIIEALFQALSIENTQENQQIAMVGGKIIGMMLSPDVAFAFAGFSGVEFLNSLSKELEKAFTGEGFDASQVNWDSLIETISALLFTSDSWALKLAGAAGTVFSNESTRNQVMEALFGPLVNPNDEWWGTREGNGLVSQFVKLFIGEDKLDENGEIIEHVNGLWDEIVAAWDAFAASNEGQAILGWIGGIVEGAKQGVIDFFAGLWDSISPYLDYIGYKFQEWFFGMVDESVLRDFLKFIGLDVGKPREFEVLQKNGERTTISQMEAAGASMAEIAEAIWLTSHPENTEIAEAKFTGESLSAADFSEMYPGMSEGAYGAYSALVTAARYGDENARAVLLNISNGGYVSGEHNSFYTAPSAFETALINVGSAYGLHGAPKPYTDYLSMLQELVYGETGVKLSEDAPDVYGELIDSFSDDMTQGEAESLYRRIMEMQGGANPEIPVDVDIDPAQIQRDIIAGGPYTIPTISADSGGTDGQQAWGGRIGSEGVYTVGEDGPEYIIPITKPQRAMSLILSMLREMGGDAMRQVVEGLGLNGGSDTVGGSLSSLQGYGAGISIVNNVNVTNTILVHGGDRSAMEIGTAAYDASERYLLRTLRGVLA